MGHYLDKKYIAAVEYERALNPYARRTQISHFAELPKHLFRNIMVHDQM